MTHTTPRTRESTAGIEQECDGPDPLCPAAARVSTATADRDMLRRMAGLFDGTPLERPVTCPVCAQPVTECVCPRDASGSVRLPQDQPVRVGRETRRKGKSVTVITGLDPVASDLKAILTKLKTACAAGGTVHEGKIEIQGDHRDRVTAMLRDHGYPAKRSGG